MLERRPTSDVPLEEIVDELPRPGDLLEILAQGPLGLFTVFTEQGSMELLRGPAQLPVMAVERDTNGSIEVRALAQDAGKTLAIRWEHGTFHARSSATLVRQ